MLSKKELKSWKLQWYWAESWRIETYFGKIHIFLNNSKKSAQKDNIQGLIRHPQGDSAGHEPAAQVRNPKGVFSRTGEGHALAGLQKVEIASEPYHCRDIKGEEISTMLLMYKHE